MLKLFAVPVAGRKVPVHVHWSFAILFVLLIMAVDLAGMLGVVVCLILHEFGHVFVAQRFGYATHSVTLHALGAAANVVDDLRRGEVRIALAGPLINIGIAVMILIGYFSYIMWQGPNPDPSIVQGPVFNFVNLMFGVNIILAGFNLLPVFPMDGGRVVRGTFTYFGVERLEATKRTAYVGTIVGGCLSIAAFVYGAYMAGIIFIIAPLLSWAEVHRLKGGGQPEHMM